MFAIQRVQRHDKTIGKITGKLSKRKISGFLFFHSLHFFSILSSLSFRGTKFCPHPTWCFSIGTFSKFSKSCIWPCCAQLLQAEPLA